MSIQKINHELLVSEIASLAAPGVYTGKVSHRTPEINALCEKINGIIDVLGATTDVTPVARTYHPIVTLGTTHTNLEALDAAIGVNPTSIAYIAIAASVNANLSTLDNEVWVINQRIVHTQSATQFIKTPLMAVATYDFARDGGVRGTIELNAGTHVIPAKAIILRGMVDIITPTDSAGDTGTIKVQVGGVDLTATIAVAATGLKALIPLGTAATAIKTSAAGSVDVVIATQDLTAGKLKIFIEYVVSE